MLTTEQQEHLREMLKERQATNRRPQVHERSASWGTGGVVGETSARHGYTQIRVAAAGGAATGGAEGGVGYRGPPRPPSPSRTQFQVRWGGVGWIAFNVVWSAVYVFGRVLRCVLSILNSVTTLKICFGIGLVGVLKSCLFECLLVSGHIFEYPVSALTVFTFLVYFVELVMLAVMFHGTYQHTK